MKQLIPGNEVESPQNKSHYMQKFFVDIFYGIGFNWLAPDRKLYLGVFYKNRK